MLQAYLECWKDKTGCRSATVSSGGVDRAVGFALEQNKATKKVRRIQLLTAPPCSRALIWVRSTKRRDLSLWESVRQILQTNGHGLDATSPCFCLSKAQVRSVRRIENMRLWHSYKTMRRTISPCLLQLLILMAFAIIHNNTMARSQQPLGFGEALAVKVDAKILS